MSIDVVTSWEFLRGRTSKSVFLIKYLFSLTFSNIFSNFDYKICIHSTILKIPYPRTQTCFTISCIIFWFINLLLISKTNIFIAFRKITFQRQVWNMILFFYNYNFINKCFNCFCTKISTMQNHWTDCNSFCGLYVKCATENVILRLQQFEINKLERWY